MQETSETQIQSLGQKDPLEKGMATLQYSCLENTMDKGTWQLQSILPHRDEHNWSNLAHMHSHIAFYAPSNKFHSLNLSTTCKPFLHVVGSYQYRWALTILGLEVLTLWAVKNLPITFTVNPSPLRFYIHEFNQPWILWYTHSVKHLYKWTYTVQSPVARASSFCISNYIYFIFIYIK